MSGEKGLSIKEIYVNLLKEGVSVVRPVDAIEISPNVYRILESNIYNSDDEEWEFLPGTTVECQEEAREGKKLLVAKKRIGTSGGTSGDV